MDRRSFFRRGTQKLAQAATETLRHRVEARAKHWIRPPFALPELDFLLACTRCAACIEACPHGVIFELSAKVGATAAATPALDLTQRGCQLCNDWPCVTACAAHALRRDEESSDQTLPRLARALIDRDQCLPYRGPECGACRDSCPVPGALVWQGSRPMIDVEQCIGCAQCRSACIVEPGAIVIKSLEPSGPGQAIPKDGRQSVAAPKAAPS